MCLYTKQPRPAVAEKTINCYKTVRCQKINGIVAYFFSEFYGFRYEIGKEYIVKKGKIISFPDDESYLPKKRKKNHVVSYGFHSYARLKDAMGAIDYDNYNVIFKCEIPVGAKYWTGNIDLYEEGDCNYKEYCSERIKVVAWRYKKDSKWNYGTVPGE